MPRSKDTTDADGCQAHGKEAGTARGTQHQPTILLYLPCSLLSNLNLSFILTECFILQSGPPHYREPSKSDVSRPLAHAHAPLCPQAS